MKIVSIKYNAISTSRLKKLLTFCKKYRKFGVWIDVEDCGINIYNATLYQPVRHIDVLGNMAIKP